MKVNIKRLKGDPDYWDEVAPEGATHYAAKGSLFSWERREGDFWYFYRDHEWSSRPFSRRGDSRIEYTDFEIIPRPTKAGEEWSGGGLPPVGCKCEMLHPGIKRFGWQEVTIKAYFDDRVAIIKGNKNIWEAGGYCAIYIDDDLQFRPTHTKEQSLRDDLAEQVAKTATLKLGKILEDWEYDAIADAVLEKYELKERTNES